MAWIVSRVASVFFFMLRATLFLLLAACAAPAPHGARSLAARAPRRLAVTVDERSAGCCSQSCGARSTVAELTLTLGGDGRAAGMWTRAGCNVVLSGDGVVEMPLDPGEPASLCGQPAHPGARREEIDLAARSELSGSWSEDADGLQIVLVGGGNPAWTLSCAREATTVLACRALSGEWSDGGDLVADGVLYLGDAPRGATVHVRTPGFGARPRVEIAP